MSEYSNPELLVSTDWVAEQLDDPSIVIVESNEDILLYETGHSQNAVKVDWQNELQDQLVRDYVNKDDFEKLMSEKGISNDHTVVFYGDRSNWWACYALWTFKVLGHEKCLIMNGGRQKWVDEERPLTKDVAARDKTDYKVAGISCSIDYDFTELIRVNLHSIILPKLTDLSIPINPTDALCHLEQAKRVEGPRAPKNRQSQITYLKLERIY